MAEHHFNRCAITFVHGSYFEIIRTAYYYNSTSQDSDAHTELANSMVHHKPIRKFLWTLLNYYITLA